MSALILALDTIESHRPHSQHYKTITGVTKPTYPSLFNLQLLLGSAIQVEVHQTSSYL